MLQTWVSILKLITFCNNESKKQLILNNISKAPGIKILTFINAHAMNLASKKKFFQTCITNSDLLLRDGSGMNILCKACRISPGLNLNGTDLIPELLLKFPKETSIALFGTSDTALTTAIEVFKAKGYQTITSLDGFQSVDSYIQLIERTSPRLIILGMGMPKQEYVACQIKDTFSNSNRNILIINGGGIIDFISGKSSRAPIFMRKLGIEWLHRLISNPRRLWLRNIQSIIFLINVFRLKNKIITKLS